MGSREERQEGSPKSVSAVDRKGDQKRGGPHYRGLLSQSYLWPQVIYRIRQTLIPKMLSYGTYMKEEGTWKFRDETKIEEPKASAVSGRGTIEIEGRGGPWGEDPFSDSSSEVSAPPPTLQGPTASEPHAVF